jgi:hypothetical protein
MDVWGREPIEHAFKFFESFSREFAFLTGPPTFHLTLSGEKELPNDQIGLANHRKGSLRTIGYFDPI